MYNEYMGRNYFSKAGGPYFINNGLSGHIEHHNHDDSHTHEDMNKPIKPLYLILSGVLSIGFVIGITMFILY